MSAGAANHRLDENKVAEKTKQRKLKVSLTEHVGQRDVECNIDVYSKGVLTTRHCTFSSDIIYGCACPPERLLYILELIKILRLKSKLNTQTNQDKSVRRHSAGLSWIKQAEVR